MDAPNHLERRSVNASLTVSEIQLMTLTRAGNSRVMDLFVDRLKRLPAGQKAKDHALEAYVYRIIWSGLKGHQDLLTRFSDILPPGESITLGRRTQNTAEENLVPSAEFSEAQLRVYADTLRYLDTAAGRAFRFRRTVVEKMPSPVVRSALKIRKTFAELKRDAESSSWSKT